MEHVDHPITRERLLRTGAAGALGMTAAGRFAPVAGEDIGAISVGHVAKTSRAGPAIIAGACRGENLAANGDSV